ncbi:Similarity [Microcystis aeruginosa PCC 9808]|uniref:Similarity n=2 Tax=Microcystis TaxID=1125 RepID=I4I2U7_MICAE|nr:MAG: hypothetical protein DWQ54_13730 [Microcystis flos-aquae TF09]ROI06316.1 hypothetical protein ED562_09025 [Microcystis aeruginosa FACHB-524]CCI28621.1 Similarity [Microcystis aeruginosa PCC 9808]
MKSIGSLTLVVISLTYIRPINLCVLCVFVVRSIRSPVGMYLRIDFTHQTQESRKSPAKALGGFAIAATKPRHLTTVPVFLSQLPGGKTPSR